MNVFLKILAICCITLSFVASMLYKIKADFFVKSWLREKQKPNGINNLFLYNSYVNCTAGVWIWLTITVISTAALLGWL